MCIENERYCFVDFFDTTVFRRVTVGQALYRWAVCLKKVVPCLDNLSAEEIVELRKKSFVLAAEKKEEPTYEHAMSYMYGLLHKQNEKSLREDFLKKTMDIEIAIEYGCQYPNNGLIKKLKKLKEKGVKIICISDFYMGSDCLKKFLYNCSVEENIFDSYFVSCECGRSKAKGTIYGYAIESLGIKNIDNIVMIGDHKGSDYRNAKKAGIKAVLKRNLFHKALIRLKEVMSLRYETQQVKFVAKFGYRQGYCFSEYVLAFYYFIKQLYKLLDADGISAPVFMAREGYYLRELFDLYGTLCLPESKHVKTKYFRCSRRSVYAGVDEEEIKDEKQEPISVRNWLKTIDFTVNDFRKYVNLEDSELDRVGMIKESPAYIEAVNNPEFVVEYKKRVAQNRESFILYFKDFIEGNSLNIIDSGWKGTTQTALLKYYNISSRGYYIGVQKNEDFPESLYRKGLLFEENDGRYYEYVGMNFPFYQQLLAAPHGSAVKYVKQNDGSVKVLEEWDQDEKNLYHEYIKDFQRHITSLFMGMCVWNELDGEKEEWIIAKTIFHSNMFVYGERKKFAMACENSFFVNFLQEKKGTKNYDYRDVKIGLDFIYLPEKYIRYITKIQRSSLYEKKNVRILYPLFAVVFYNYVLLIHWIKKTFMGRK